MKLGIFAGLGSAADSFISTYVVATSTNVATGIAPLVLTGFTLWVMMYGYSVMRQEVSDPFNVFFKNVVKFGLIFGIALSGGVYQNVVIDSVNSFQDGLVSLVTPSSGVISVTGGNIYQLLDDLNEKGATMALFILMRGSSLLPFGGWLDLIAGCLVFAANALLMFMCGGFAFMTKVALSFIMGIGPLFIACLAFPPLAKFFDAWFGKVMNYVLLIATLAFSIGFSISVADSYLTHAIVEGGVLTNPVSQVKEAFNLVILYCCLIFFVYQSPHIASGLAGGASLSGGGIAQMAIGTMIGKMGAGNKNDNDPKKKGGGSIEGGKGADGNNSGSGSGSNGGGQPASTPRVPAYRRVSRNRYGSRK